ncbi:MAG: BON domain-containing protein [Pirellulales bacterium]|jgi:osmotically-inducible protein OsmY
MSESATGNETRALLHDRCANVLANNPYLTKRGGVEVSTDEGRVTLHGKVHTFYQKQMAQEIIRRVDGVTEISNQLEVHWS